MHDLLIQLVKDDEVLDNPLLSKQIVDDIQSRLHLGIKRYGQPLRANNGRNAKQDLYEELTDAMVYALQIREEEPEHADVWNNTVIENLYRVWSILAIMQAAKKIDEVGK